MTSLVTDVTDFFYVLTADRPIVDVTPIHQLGYNVAVNEVNRPTSHLA